MHKRLFASWLPRAYVMGANNIHPLRTSVLASKARLGFGYKPPRSIAGQFFARSPGATKNCVLRRIKVFFAARELEY